MLRIESLLIAVLLVLAFIYPKLGARWFVALEDRLSWLSRRRALSVLLVGLTALALRSAILPLEPIPEPIVHDEFAYLLAGNTFAHGRLTNPSPRMWAHFESFGIILKPTYQCYAQPAQGIVLAIGESALGHPFWGVWLTAGVMCAAITWMLQGWVGEGWALVGGLFAILRIGTFTYWANSYWGGATAAIGGALVLGALVRIRSQQRPRDAVLMALGLTILANSRPYEGFVFSLPVAVALLVWLFRKRSPSLRTSIRRVVLPICAVLVLAGASMGYYFWRVTGNPLHLPYQVERETYATVPYFLWQHSRPLPTYRSLEIERLYAQSDVARFEADFHSRSGFLSFLNMKIQRTWLFYLGPVLSVPLLMMAIILPFAGKGRMEASTRFLLIQLAIFFLAQQAETYFDIHYAAPITCVLLALILIAMRQLQNWEPKGRPVGVAINRAIIVVCIFSFGMRVYAAEHGWNFSRSRSPTWFQLGPKSFGRAALKSKLEGLPGQQLVIVHYTPDHPLFNEWVYNEADIDGAKVVWARDISPASNQELLDYFKGRRVWLLQADETPARLSAYTPQPDTSVAEEQKGPRDHSQ